MVSIFKWLCPPIIVLRFLSSNSKMLIRTIVLLGICRFAQIIIQDLFLDYRRFPLPNFSLCHQYCLLVRFSGTIFLLQFPLSVLSILLLFIFFFRLIWNLCHSFVLYTAVFKQNFRKNEFSDHGLLWSKLCYLFDVKIPVRPILFVSKHT